MYKMIEKRNIRLIFVICLSILILMGCVTEINKTIQDAISFPDKITIITRNPKEDKPYYLTQKNYIPPNNVYDYQKRITVGVGYDVAYELTKESLSSAEIIEHNKEAGLIVVSSDSKETGTYADCGEFIAKYPFRNQFYVLLSNVKYDMHFNRVNDTNTSIEINQRNIKEGYVEYYSTGYSYYMFTKDSYPILNQVIDCISTGKFEKTLFNSIENRIAYLQREIEKKKREEKQRKEKELRDQRRKKLEEERRLAREIEDQRRKKEREKREKERKIKREMLLKEYSAECNGEIISFVNFIMGKNPYADKGKCTMIQATTFQMTSKKTGLFSAGNQILYIEFPQTFRGPYVRGIAKIKGVYTYPTTIGTTNTVPHLQVISELSGNEYYLLEK